MTAAIHPRLLREAIVRADFLRRPPPDGERGHREWFHFSIALPDLTLIVNISVADDETRPAPAERARAVVLVRHAGRWFGATDVARSESEIEARGGQIHLRVAQAEVSFEDGAFVFRRRPRAGDKDDLELALRFEPVSLPSVANSVRVGARGESVSWVVVPSLRASGTVRTGSAEIPIDDVPAYHDHNWGYFSHRNFEWQWGHAVAPDRDGTSCVFARLLDRGRAESFMQSVLLWKAGRQYRVFREHEIAIASSGYLRPATMFTLPRELSLVAGGATATDIPRCFRFRAEGAGDIVEGVFESRSAARIAVPNDHDLGTTLIHETAGVLSLQGRVRGEAIASETDAVFEFLGRGP